MRVKIGTLFPPEELLVENISIKKKYHSNSLYEILKSNLILIKNQISIYYVG